MLKKADEKRDKNYKWHLQTNKRKMKRRTRTKTTNPKIHTFSRNFFEIINT